MAGVIAVGFSRAGRAVATKMPLWLLVGFQGFRLPLELVMHRAQSEGVMPVQMSYSGSNFDIISGGSAVLVAIVLMLRKQREPRWLVFGWNLIATGLLVVIVAIAVVSTPVFAAFGPEELNTWVAYFPAVWLPCVLVPSALLGHILLWRRLSGL